MNNTTNMQELALMHEEDPSLFTSIECIDLIEDLYVRLLKIKHQYPDATKLPQEYRDELAIIYVMMGDIDREMRFSRNDRRN